MSPLSVDETFAPPALTSGFSSSFRAPQGGVSPVKASGGEVGSPHTEDPYDFKATVGNLSLSLW